MANDKSPTGERSTIDSAGEPKLSDLKGSEQKAIADQSDRETGRSPDTEELRLDRQVGGTDTLYGDGIHVEEDYDTPSGTHGSQATIP
jgi:hypothetical protein